MSQISLPRVLLAFALFVALLLPVKIRALDIHPFASGSSHYVICSVSLKTDHLSLFLDDPAGKPFHTFDAINAALAPSGRALAFAMNGGMYEPNFSPVGLFIADTHQVKALNLSPGIGNFYLRPNGVFYTTGASARVLTSRDFNNLRPEAQLATQSGPMLVVNDQINSAFSPTSTSRLIRNGVGVTGSGSTAIFVIADTPVNFYEFARLFRDILHCPNALFLDGTVSSLYAPTLHRNDVKIPLGPIIGIVR